VSLILLILKSSNYHASLLGTIESIFISAEHVVAEDVIHQVPRGIFLHFLFLELQFLCAGSISYQL
jgi:hypothetical protein